MSATGIARIVNRVLGTTVILLLAVSLLAFFSSTARAAPGVCWREGGALVSGDTENPYGLSMVPDGKGGVICTWIESRGLCGQRVNSEGELLWGPDGKVIRDHGPMYEYPDMGMCSDGQSGVYIAWTDWKKIKALRIDEKGEVAGGWRTSGVPVVEGGSSYEYHPKVYGVLPAPEGGFYVCGHASLDFIQRMNPDGTVHPSWPLDGLLGAGGTKVATDGLGGLLWDSRDEEDHDPIVGRTRPDGSSPPGWEDGIKLRTYIDNDDLHIVNLCHDGDGGCFLLTKTVNSSSGGASYHIYCRHITSGGKPNPDWGGIYLGYYGSWGDRTIYDHYLPIFPDGRGGAIVHFETSMERAFFRVAKDGLSDRAWGGEDGISIKQTDYRWEDHIIIPDEMGGVYFFDVGPEGIHARRITASGIFSPGWPRDGLFLEAPLHAYDNDVSACASSDGSSFIMWRDVSEDPTKRLYVQKIADPPPFNTYLCIQNPNQREVEAVITYMLPDGVNIERKKNIPANSRQTVYVNEQIPALDVSTRVEVASGDPVICERSMYFDYRSAVQGGHDCAGTAAPGKVWYLSEGYTGGSFDTFLLLQNSGDVEADVTVTFMLPEGERKSESYEVAPRSRETIEVDAIEGLEATEVSMKAESSESICVERSMYFDYYGRKGGHVQNALPPYAEKSWYFPEGYTAGDFDTYILVQNPGSIEANVNLTYMKTDGNTLESQLFIPPKSRSTVKVDEVPGMSACEFSTEVLSNKPLLCERSVYFDYNGKQGGHDSAGATAPSSEWFLAEGYTAGDFDTYLLIQNPEESAVQVRATFMKPDGTITEGTYKIDPRSRYTIKVDEIPGFEATEVSAMIQTDDGKGIVAERAVYFACNGEWTGGHVAMGIAQPSSTWYFAEGCTGY